MFRVSAACGFADQRVERGGRLVRDAALSAKPQAATLTTELRCDVVQRYATVCDVGATETLNVRNEPNCTTFHRNAPFDANAQNEPISCGANCYQ